MKLNKYPKVADDKGGVMKSLHEINRYIQEGSDENEKTLGQFV